MFNEGKRMTQEIIQDLEIILEKENLDLEQKQSLEMIIMDTQEFVKYNEWIVGLECMLDNIYEYSIPLTKELVQKMKDASVVGKLKENYYSDFHKLIR